MKRQLELNLENEQWLPIEGYEELYQVSNYGRVKSLERINSLGRTVKERILKQVNDNNGYQRICLCKDGKKKIFNVHRLVASAFIPNPNNLPQVNHKDEVKTNNHVDNLEWCSAKYNVNYGTARERLSKTKSGKFGKDCPNSKQVIQLTLNGDYIKYWNSMMDVKRELGFNQHHICSCCRGKRKSANGYKWQYV